MLDQNSLIESDDWRQYRERLNAFIKSSESGMIINADDEWDFLHPGDSKGRAGFKLQSGRVVKEFVTIWELFDNRDEFRKCIEKLAEKALEIRERTRFSRIVTATPTAKELAEYLFDAIQKKDPKQEFALSHFGNYPASLLAQGSSQNFKEDEVIILTDVVNSGYLIKEMAEVVVKNGGRVASILSIIITNPDWIRDQRKESRPVTLKLQNSEASLHNLADYEIPTLQEGDYDEAKVIPIDYSSVLPERKKNSETRYSPEFPLTKTFEHLETAHAIDFGFYEFDDSRFTSAFVLPRLLDKYGDDIWSHIREPIVAAAEECGREPISEKGEPNELLLVTTYKHKDLLFQDYIQSKLSDEGYHTTTAITLKRGITDTPYLNLTLGASGKEVRGKVVILAMATLFNHEKLRNTVSLLVDGQVKKIIVICLLNRMGPFTTNFIAAIERFTKRVSFVVNKPLSQGSPTGTKSQFTDFDFHMVYRFLDLRSSDLYRINNELDWLFEGFRRHTKVSSFGRLCDRMENYFRPKTYVSRTYRTSEYEPLAQPYSLDIDNKGDALTITVSTQEAKIALMTYNLALNRDFRPILSELVQTRDRVTFIHLYGLLLSDIHYLRFTGALSDLKEKIFARLDDLREERFNLEKNRGGDMTMRDIDRVRDVINAEVYLIFGLGLIAHHNSQGHSESWLNLIVKLLFCNKDPDEWFNEYPNSLSEYFGEERIFFVISFVLHGLYPEFSRGNVAPDLKKKLNAVVDRYKAAFRRKFDNTEKTEIGSKARIKLIINNLDLILTEAGKHDNLEKHQYVRYLHREVLRPKEGHNPILTTLKALIETMSSFVNHEPTSEKSEKFDLNQELLTRVDDALSGTSSLQMIARSVRQLFFFTPTMIDQQTRFISVVGQEGFASDVDDLVGRLNDIRLNRNFSTMDRRRLMELDRKLRTDFLDAESPLRKTLKSYVVDLGEIVGQALFDVNERLNMEGFNDLLMPLCSYIQDKRTTGECFWPVLADRHILRETLRNLFSNLHHTFPLDQRSTLPRDAIEIELRRIPYAPYPERQTRLGVALRISVKGRPPNRGEFLRPENTISDQLLKIQEMGGDWDLIPESDNKQYTFVLKLLTRFGHLERGQMSRNLSDEEIRGEIEQDEDL